MDLEMLRQRAKIIQQTRSFFEEKKYLEVDTPLLAPDLIPESCLEVFQTQRITPGGAEARPCWLVPSPEIWMKKIIAQYRVNIFQICKCFRNGESCGHLHSPEFTMLEYYTVDAGCMDSLALTEELFAYLSPGSASFKRITVAEAFGRWAGFDLFAAAGTKDGMETEARRLGLDPPPGLGIPALYDLIFIHAVEPEIKNMGLLALLDYPAFVPCLAKKNGRTVERWELYADGIELANCFSEETDPVEVRRFFESEAVSKEKTALIRHHVDHNYWKIFQGMDDQGFPPCSGVALGLDRLVMYYTGKSSIDAVLPFP